MKAKVQVELTQHQVDVLFPALKAAEGVYTTNNEWQACKDLSVVYDTLKKQIFDYEEA